MYFLHFIVQCAPTIILLVNDKLLEESYFNISLDAILFPLEMGHPPE